MKSLNNISSKAVVFAALLAIAGCGEITNRNDFVAQVKDKSTSEVAAAIGKPTAIDDSDPGIIRWIYDRKTFSTESGSTQLDKKTIVVFRQVDANSPATMVEVVYQ